MVRLVPFLTFDSCPSSYLSCSQSLGSLAELFPLHTVFLRGPFSLLLNHLPVGAFPLSQQREWTHPERPCLGVNFAAESFPTCLPSEPPELSRLGVLKWILDEGNHTFCQGEIILDEVIKWNNWLSFACAMIILPLTCVSGQTEAG